VLPLEALFVLEPLGIGSEEEHRGFGECPLEVDVTDLLAGGAAAAAIAQAIKASGAIVRVAPNYFLTILGHQQAPLVVCSTGGFISTSYRYLSSYRGLAFFTKSPKPLNLPGNSEIVNARKIWIPG